MNLVKLKEDVENEGFYLNYPHLGLAYLASMLEKNKFTVRIIDSSASLININEIIKILKEEKPSIIGITVTTQTLRSVYLLVKEIKKASIKSEIVLGGPHISAEPEIIKKIDVKYGFVGEAEYGLIKLCEFIIRKKGSINNIKGLVYKKNHKLKINERDFIKNLDLLPFPARRLLPNDKYFSPVISGRITSMIATRGCPFNCIYCSRAAMGRQCFHRSPENIAEEMKECVEKYNVKYIEFVDDTFTIKQDKILSLCKLIKEKNIKVKWGCQTRANLVDKKLLKEMHSAGCMKISFGVETGSQRVRYLLNKYISDEAFRNACKWCKEIGIETNAFFMFGHPTETIEEMEQTIKFAKELDTDYAAFYITTIVPASLLFNIALKEKLVNSDVWEKYMLGKVELPAYIPEKLNFKILEEMHRKAFRSFYLRPKYILKRIFKLKNFSELRNTVRIGCALFKNYF